MIVFFPYIPIVAHYFIKSSKIKQIHLCYITRLCFSQKFTFRKCTSISSSLDQPLNFQRLYLSQIDTTLVESFTHKFDIIMYTFQDQQLIILTPLCPAFIVSNIDYQLTFYQNQINQFPRNNMIFHYIILPSYMKNTIQTTLYKE